MKTKKPAEPTNAELRAQAIRVVRERSLAPEFFHDHREAYATVPVADHRETWPIGSDYFRFWVMHILYEQLGAAPKRMIDACLEEFKIHAICKGKEFHVHVRIAEHNGATYIHLVNDRWQVLEVTAAGWHILDDSPVKFRREEGMENLPYPQDGGDFGDLSRFLNIGAQNEVLLLAWLTYALLLNTPYPIVALSGVHGSAKSTITEVLRKLIEECRYINSFVQLNVARLRAVQGRSCYIFRYSARTKQTCQFSVSVFLSERCPREPVGGVRDDCQNIRKRCIKVVQIVPERISASRTRSGQPRQ